MKHIRMIFQGFNACVNLVDSQVYDQVYDQVSKRIQFPFSADEVYCVYNQVDNQINIQMRGVITDETYLWPDLGAG